MLAFNLDFVKTLEGITQVKFTHVVGSLGRGEDATNWNSIGLKKLSIEQAMSDKMGGHHFLFDLPARQLKKTMSDFRAAQRVLGSDCSTGVFIVPVSKAFRIRPINMLSCGHFNPHCVYTTVNSKNNPLCLFPASRLEAFFCMSTLALRTAALPQAETRAQASDGGLMPLLFARLLGPSKGQQHLRAEIFMDSGATHCFIDKSLVGKLNLTLIPTHHSTTKLGNGSQSKIIGAAAISMSIQGVTDVVECLVMDCMMPGFDVILGNSWFIKNDAWLNPARKIAIINSKNQKYVLYAVGSTELQTDVDDAFMHEPISYKEFNVYKKSGCRIFVCNAIPTPAIDADVLGYNGILPNSTDIPNPDPVIPDCIKPILEKFHKIFEPRPIGLPPYRQTGPIINLEPGSKPPTSRVRRMTPAEAIEAKKNIDDGLARGIIQESTSPYSAPIMFVTKKDGKLRQVHDYRCLNNITIKNKYPMPMIQDVIDTLQGCKFFSSMDCESAYHQVLLDPSDIQKTAFITPWGLFEFKVLVFGLCNAPAAFVAELTAIFKDILGSYVILYLDDILIFSKTSEDHVKHVAEVCRRLQISEFYIKISKCSFMVQELKFLGDIVGINGVKVDPAKVQSVKA